MCRVLARAAGALVHVHVAVAAKRSVGRALHHGALRRVFVDEGDAEAVRKPRQAHARIGVRRDRCVHRRFVAGGIVLARAASALVHINVAVATPRRIVKAVRH